MVKTIIIARNPRNWPKVNIEKWFLFQWFKDKAFFWNTPRIKAHLSTRNKQWQGLNTFSDFATFALNFQKKGWRAKNETPFSNLLDCHRW